MTFNREQKIDKDAVQTAFANVLAELEIAIFNRWEQDLVIDAPVMRCVLDFKPRSYTKVENFRVLFNEKVTSEMSLPPIEDDELTISMDQLAWLHDMPVDELKQQINVDRETLAAKLKEDMNSNKPLLIQSPVLLFNQARVLRHDPDLFESAMKGDQAKLIRAAKLFHPSFLVRLGITKYLLQLFENDKDENVSTFLSQLGPRCVDAMIYSFIKKREYKQGTNRMLPFVRKKWHKTMAVIASALTESTIEGIVDSSKPYYIRFVLSHQKPQFLLTLLEKISISKLDAYTSISLCNVLESHKAYIFDHLSANQAIFSREALERLSILFGNELEIPVSKDKRLHNTIMSQIDSKKYSSKSSRSLVQIIEDAREALSKRVPVPLSELNIVTRSGKSYLLTHPELPGIVWREGLMNPADGELLEQKLADNTEIQWVVKELKRHDCLSKGMACNYSLYRQLNDLDTIEEKPDFETLFRSAKEDELEQVVALSTPTDMLRLLLTVNPVTKKSGYEYAARYFSPKLFATIFSSFDWGDVMQNMENELILNTMTPGTLIKYQSKFIKQHEAEFSGFLSGFFVNVDMEIYQEQGFTILHAAASLEDAEIALSFIEFFTGRLRARSRFDMPDDIKEYLTSKDIDGNTVLDVMLTTKPAAIVSKFLLLCNEEELKLLYAASGNKQLLIPIVLELIKQDDADHQRINLLFNVIGDDLIGPLMRLLNEGIRLPTQCLINMMNFAYNKQRHPEPPEVSRDLLFILLKYCTIDQLDEFYFLLKWSNYHSYAFLTKSPQGETLLEMLLPRGKLSYLSEVIYGFPLDLVIQISKYQFETLSNTNKLKLLHSLLTDKHRFYRFNYYRDSLDERMFHILKQAWLDGVFLEDEILKETKAFPINNPANNLFFEYYYDPSRTMPALDLPKDEPIYSSQNRLLNLKDPQVTLTVWQEGFLCARHFLIARRHQNALPGFTNVLDRLYYSNTIKTGMQQQYKPDLLDQQHQNINQCIREGHTALQLMSPQRWEAFLALQKNPAMQNNELFQVKPINKESNIIILSDDEKAEENVAILYDMRRIHAPYIYATITAAEIGPWKGAEEDVSKLVKQPDSVAYADLQAMQSSDIMQHPYRHCLMYAKLKLQESLAVVIVEDTPAARLQALTYQSTLQKQFGLSLPIIFYAPLAQSTHCYLPEMITQDRILAEKGIKIDVFQERETEASLRAFAAALSAKKEWLSYSGPFRKKTVSKSVASANEMLITIHQQQLNPHSLWSVTKSSVLKKLKAGIKNADGKETPETVAFYTNQRNKYFNFQ